MLYLIRHGETPWSASGKHTGVTDVPLTPQGEKEAERLGAYLAHISFTRVFTSPAKRAKETCRIAGCDAQATISPGLLEWDYGRYEGKTSEEIHRETPGWTIFTQGAPEGESIADACARADGVLRKLAGIEGPVALFSSGHILRLITMRWLGLPPALGDRFPLQSGSLSLLGKEKGQNALLLWNMRP
jgi:probable phosphoglycerate mutase